ncbi:MAG: hypothetical protein PF447_06190 [Spirochaetaceae bacterium]|jgi:hypothetical protein|nr:hypothetical protein [Spirochaetaceae bacterium]
MEPFIWILVYLPIIAIFIHWSMKKDLLQKRKRYKEKKVMGNELIQALLGKECTVSTGTFGTTFGRVTVIEVRENWIKVEKKGKTDLINVEYITNIKIH